MAAGIALGFAGFLMLAQSPSEPSMLPAGLIGSTAYAAEGSEVGVVTAVSLGNDGQITEVRITTPIPLGLGERTVAIRSGSFIVAGGTVLLDISADEVNALPSGTHPRGAALPI